MKYRIILLLAAFAIASVIVALISREAGTSAMLDAETLDPVEGKTTVLVELFTSEGCSSCPPADRLLDELDSSQPVAGAEVIVLSEHVDYWNRLGWTDPFSSRQFSERQSEYSRAFNLDSIYTPQMVVDGEVEFVGSNSSRARSAIAAAARKSKAKVTISLLPKPDRSEAMPVKVQIENLPAGVAADVMLAVTESGLQSNVTRGENSGRKLGHTAVVRRLERIGSLANSLAHEVKLEKGWNTSRLRVVVFIQERESRRVLGAAAVQMADKTAAN